jgi:hypothetical protein
MSIQTLTAAAAEPVEAASFFLGRPPRPRIAGEQRWGEIAIGRRGAVVDDAFGCDRSADTLVDHPDDFEHPVATMCAGRDAIAHSHGRRRLRRFAVHPDVTASARIGGRRAALEHPHCPEPTVDPRALLRFHGSVAAGRANLPEPGR